MTIYITLMMVAYYTSHPMVFSLSLVILSAVVGMLFYLKISMWMFYSITLVFLGGMMVLFLYVSMLSNEDKIVYRGPSVAFLALAVVFLQAVGLETYNHVLMYQEFEFSVLGELYKNYTIGSLSLMIFYLLLTLFTTMKFTEGFKGTMMKLSW